MTLKERLESLEERIAALEELIGYEATEEELEDIRREEREYDEEEDLIICKNEHDCFDCEDLQDCMQAECDRVMGVCALCHLVDECSQDIEDEIEETCDIASDCSECPLNELCSNHVDDYLNTIRRHM